MSHIEKEFNSQFKVSKDKYEWVQSCKDYTPSADKDKLVFVSKDINGKWKYDEYKNESLNAINNVKIYY